MRVVTVLAAAAAVVGSAAAVATFAGPPVAPMPKVKGTNVSPPAAWVETANRSLWAAFGSYCWTTSSRSGAAACVDMIPPQMRTDIPRLRVRRGQLVRAHLGFVPRKATIALAGGRSSPLRTNGTQTLTWAARAGIVQISVSGGGGSASYLVRLG